jgi:hypothetical protein
MVNSLYLLTQGAVRGYDTYDRAVVCAPDEDTARRIHPNGDEDWPRVSRPYGTWPDDPSEVTVTYLGDAFESLPVGVVCASFNAG